MDISSICEFEGGPDTLWYMTKGHVPKDEFLAELKREYEVEYPIERVHWSYAHNWPVGRDRPGDFVINLALGPGRGHYKMTYIDCDE